MTPLRPRCGFVLNYRSPWTKNRKRLVCSLATHTGDEHRDEKHGYDFDEHGNARRYRR